MKNYQWTVFFLIRAVDKYVDDAMDMVQTVMATDLGDKISVILCVNILEGDMPAFQSGDKSAISPDGNGPITTAFFEVSWTRSASGKSVAQLMLLNEKSDFDLTNVDDLSYYFRRFILLNHQAERYMLFTWDHGMSFGIFSESVGGAPFENYVRKGASGNKVLTMDQLSQAIQWGFGRKKIDLVVMMNCFMLMLDTAYALQSAAKFLVASEGQLYTNGYNYVSLFKKLAEEPKLSTKKLAKFIVNSYARKLFDTKEDQQFYLGGVTLFACDLDKFHIFSLLIQRFFEELIAGIDAWSDVVYLAVHSAYQVIDYGPIKDFYTFLANIKGQLNDKVDLLIHLLIGIRSEIVIAELVGAVIKRETPRGHPGGFSFYLPLDSTIGGIEVNGDMRHFLETTFFVDMKMKALVKAMGPDVNRQRSRVL